MFKVIVQWISGSIIIGETKCNANYNNIYDDFKLAECFFITKMKRKLEENAWRNDF